MSAAIIFLLAVHVCCCYQIIRMDDDDLAVFLFSLATLTCYIYYKKMKPRRWWVRPIFRKRQARGAFRNIFMEAKYNDHELFEEYTRMTPQLFENLLKLLKDNRKLLKRSRRAPISPEERLAMTLKYLAHGGAMKSLAWEFYVGVSTARNIVRQTCQAIWEVLHPIYLPKPTEQDWLRIAAEFEEKWNFPHVIGAIDGKHVALDCPRNSGTLHHNYKGFFSTVLLATCDADYKFTYVDIGAYGSDSDGGIFRRCELGQQMDAGTARVPPPAHLGSLGEVPYFLVADEAFPLKEYIMRPYPGKYLERSKRIFNYRLSRARRVIENAFGILVTKWRILRRTISAEAQYTDSIIQACVCLHNYVKAQRSPSYTPSGYTDTYDTDGILIEGQWRQEDLQNTLLAPIGRVGANTATRAIIALRDRLKDYFMTEGEVLWQYAAANVSVF